MAIFVPPRRRRGRSGGAPAPTEQELDAAAPAAAGVVRLGGTPARSQSVNGDGLGERLPASSVPNGQTIIHSRATPGRAGANGLRVDRPPVASTIRPTYAALDLGTNNCRLLIARPAEDGFRVIDAFSRIVRLGEGLGARGLLSEIAMVRTLEALRICAQKVERRGVTHLRAVATEACRRAANCSEFLARVSAETGLKLEIIDGVEEARLALLGCAPLFDAEVPNALIFDIGGGSTEICWFEAEGHPALPPQSFGVKANGGTIAEPLPRAWRSLPVGVVTLAERYGGREVSGETYRAMVEEVLALLASFEAEHRLGRLIEADRLQMLGTSGTVTTLAGIDKRLPRYDRSRIDGCWLDFETARRVTDQLLRLDYRGRVAHPCIGRERADLVIAGCAILDAICRTWPVGRLRVADRGLREGILFTLMHASPGDTAGRPA